jgi:clan AA aspartic protease (TIGR02281 family)
MAFISKLSAALLLVACAAVSPLAGAQREEGPTPPQCRITAKTKVPIERSQGRFVATAKVNGNPLRMLLDTGATRSALAPRTIEALGINPSASSSARIQSIQPDSVGNHLYRLRTLEIGDASWRNRDVLSVNVVRPEQEADHESAVGIIAADVLSDYDTEIDFPAGVLTLFEASHCDGDFVPWTGDHVTLQIDPGQYKLFSITVVLNGHPLRALVDTGSNLTSVTRKAALAIGVDPAILATERAGTFVGAKGAAVQAHKHRFDTMTVGRETFRNVPMFVQDTDFAPHDMLLGMDFLKWRKVWLSYRTGQAFLQ